MKHIRGKDRISPGRQVERDADMFKRLAEDLRAEFSKDKAEAAIKEAKAKKADVREPIGYCAYCGRALYYERSYHWMYDEDCQRVRKCNDESYCRKRRIETGQKDSYFRAMMLFNRVGREVWLDFESEAKDDRDE